MRNRKNFVENEALSGKKQFCPVCGKMNMFDGKIIFRQFMANPQIQGM